MSEDLSKVPLSEVTILPPIPLSVKQHNRKKGGESLGASDKNRKHMQLAWICVCVDLPPVGTCKGRKIYMVVPFALSLWCQVRL